MSPSVRSKIEKRVAAVGADSKKRVIAIESKIRKIRVLGSQGLEPGETVNEKRTKSGVPGGISAKS